MATPKSKTGNNTFGLLVRGSISKSGGITTQSTSKSGVPQYSGAQTSNITNKTANLVSNIAGSSGLGTTLINTALRSTSFTLKTTNMIFNRLPDSLFKNLNLVFKGDITNYVKTTIQNSEFRPVADSGVHEFRPEILSVLEFSPIWEPGAITLQQDVVIRRNSDVGNFVNFQYQTKQLRQETLIGLIKNIKQSAPQGKNPFDDIRNEYVLQVRNVQQTLNYLDSVIDNINIIKNSLEIKKIPDEAYRILENNIDTKIMPLRDFFSNVMQYRQEQYNVFSETKLLLQLLFDMQNMLENYSTGLLSLIDNDRIYDYSPTKIDKTYTLQNAFTFSIKAFNTSTTAINANTEKEFNKFINSLPADVDQKITLLTYLLAKEYLISNGLGDTTNSNLLRSVGISPDNGNNVFANILGDVGNTIFDQPKSPNKDAIASLMYIDSGDPNAKIFAFENKYIDLDDQKSLYVPGSSYFTDSIITTNGKAWNIKPYTDYVNRFNNIVVTSRTLIENILKLNVFDRAGNTEGSSGDITKTIPSNLTASALNLKFIKTIYSSFDKLTSDEQSILSTLGSLSQNYAKKIILEQQQRSIQQSLVETTDPGRSAALNRINNRINLELSELNLPEISNDIQISTDQATLMAIFKLAASGYPKLHLYLFQFCILAGLCRNKELNATNVFTLLANTEIKNSKDISQLLAISNVNTNNGDELATLVPTFARLLAREISIVLAGTISDGGRRPAGPKELLFFVETGDISNILYKAAIGEGASGNTNIISYFCTLAETLFDSGKINGVNVHLLNDGTNRTRYNKLSISTQLLFIYEILSQYALKYSAINFSDRRRVELPDGILEPVPGVESLGTATSIISLSLNLSANTLIQDAFENIIVTAQEEQRRKLRTENEYYSSLEDNQERIRNEENAIRDSVGLLRIINDNLQNASSKIQNFFNQTDLQTFLRNSPVSNLNLIQNFSQVRLASYLFEDIKEKTNITDSLVANNGGDISPITDVKDKELIVSNVIIPSEYYSLVSLLSTGAKFFETVPTPYNPNTLIKRNNKIITIGIPAGFTRQLADRVNISDINKQGLQDKQSDVVILNVYPADLRFGELVLEPIKFVFDMSLFLTKKDVLDLNAVNGENYDDLLARLKITDLDNPFSPQKIGLSDLLKDTRYNFLTSQQKTQLIRNHFNSYLLDIYINFLTGTKLSEEIFLNPQNPGKTLTEKTATLARNYLLQMGEVPPQNYVSTDDILASANYSDVVKDTYRLLTYGSVVFNRNEVEKIVTTPKLFDRTFNVPINLNQLKIDVAATSSTKAGQEVLNKKFYQKYITRRKNDIYLRADSDKDFIVKNIFVTIETAIDTVAQDAQKPKPAAVTSTIGKNSSLSTSISKNVLYNNPRFLSEVLIKKT